MAEDDLTQEPLPDAAENELHHEDISDRRLRRWLSVIAVLAAVGTWILLVSTVAAVSVILALYHPDALGNFVKIAYPCVGASGIGVGSAALLEHVLGSLGPKGGHSTRRKTS
jgi:hypothetical protein